MGLSYLQIYTILKQDVEQVYIDSSLSYLQIYTILKLKNGRTVLSNVFKLPTNLHYSQTSNARE